MVSIFSCSDSDEISVMQNFREIGIFTIKATNFKKRLSQSFSKSKNTCLKNREYFSVGIPFRNYTIRYFLSENSLELPKFERFNERILDFFLPFSAIFYHKKT